MKKTQLSASQISAKQLADAKKVAEEAANALSEGSKRERNCSESFRRYWR